MAPPADDVDGGAKSTFRWLDAARCAVASVVTVLIVTVIAYAIVVVLRPVPLVLLVARGCVSVERRNLTSPEVIFRFTLTAVNPSGRARIYYTNIKGIIRGKANPLGTVNDFLGFKMPRDIGVSQQSTVLSYGQVHGYNSSSMSLRYQKPYFDMFYNNDSSVIPDAIMKLNGTITVERYSGYHGNYTIGHPVVYYCWPLAVGSDVSLELEETASDVRCTEDLPTS